MIANNIICVIADECAINIPIHETNKFSVREVGDGCGGASNKSFTEPFIPPRTSWNILLHSPTTSVSICVCWWNEDGLIYIINAFFCTFNSQCKVCVSFSVSLPLTSPGHKSPCQRESAGGWANKQTDRQRMTTTVTDWMGVRDRQSGREWTRPCRKWDCLALVTYIHRQKMRLLRGWGWWFRSV